MLPDVIDVSFTGLNCVKEFVWWLKEEGFILSTDNPNQCLNLIKFKYIYGVKTPFNIMVAHNGNKFDYKFLISALQEFNSM